MLTGRNPLFIALALGVLAFGVSWSALRAQKRRDHRGWETVRILCADQDIPEGTTLDRAMVAARDIPVRFVTDSFIRIDEGDRAKTDVYFGQRILVPLKKGDPILASHFESAREADFSTMINQKGRAISIDVQERRAVGLWVRPNDHVDVVGTFHDPASHEPRTVTLLQNVVVLATGHVNANTNYVPDDEKRYQTVTLLVLPEEAEILTLAQEEGTLTLVLRNPDDLDYQQKRGVVDVKSLFTGERAGELQQKRYRTIQIIRGNRGAGAGGQ